MPEEVRVANAEKVCVVGRVRATCVYVYVYVRAFVDVRMSWCFWLLLAQIDANLYGLAHTQARTRPDTHIRLHTHTHTHTAAGVNAH